MTILIQTLQLKKKEVQIIAFLSQSFVIIRWKTPIQISIGWKHSSHDCVESKFIQELEDLKSGANNFFLNEIELQHKGSLWNCGIYWGPARTKFNQLLDVREW